MPCPSLEVLKHLLAGDPPEAESDGALDHVNACAACQTLLDSLSDDPELRSWLVEQPRTKTEPKNDEGLVRLLKNLGRQDGIAQEFTNGMGPTTVDPSEFLAPPQAPGELGRLGPYRILRVLGIGGMGVVFEAEDPALKRRVALKVMKPALAARTASRERFLREAQAIAALEHENIVTIYQVGEDQDVAFLAMQLLQGETLEARLDRAGRLSSVEAVRLGRQIADGLATAHACGLIHRDIKPANVFLEHRNGERVKLLDFGLARSLEDKVHLTQSGAIAGTPAYMAPEQASDDPVDHRCDLFSLGCVLYRMTTGQVPFPGHSVMAIMKALATATPKPPRHLNPELPTALNDLILQLLARDPARRPGSAREVALTLATLEKQLAEPAATNPTTRPSAKRWLVTAVALLGFCALAVGVVVILRDRFGNEVTPTTNPDGNVAIKKNEEIIAPPGKLELVYKLEGHDSLIQHLAFLPDSRRAVSLAWGGGPCRLWDVVTGKELRQYEVPEQYAKLLTRLAVSPDGRTLAVGTSASHVLTWDIETGKPGQRYTYQGFPSPPSISALTFSPDGKFLLLHAKAPSGETRLVLWKLGEKEPRREFAGGDQPSRKLVFLPDGASFLAGDKEAVVLWKIDQDKPLGRFEGHLYGANDFLLHPDGKRLIVAAGDGKVLVWDLHQGTRIKELSDPQRLRFRAVQSLALYPGNRLLAAGWSGKTFLVWDLETGEVKDRLQEPTNCFLRVAVSPDGRSVITGGGGDQDPEQKFKVILDGDYALRVFRLTPPDAPGLPFVLLARGDTNARTFATLADAVAVAKDGDTIEVRGEGPFICEPIDIGAKALTLRAGPGCQPLLQLGDQALEAGRPLLTTGAPLVLEGLTLEGRAPSKVVKTSAFVLSRHGDLSVANCRFLVTGHVFAIKVQPGRRVEVRNTLFLGPVLGALNVSGDSQPGGVVSVSHCILHAASVTVGIELRDFRELTVSLRHNTFIDVSAFGLNLGAQNPREGEVQSPVQVDVQANVFAGRFAFTYGVWLKKSGAAYPELAELLAWKEGANLHAARPAWLQTSLYVPGQPDARSTSVPTLAAWKEYWQIDRNDVVEGAPRFTEGQLASKLKSTPASLNPHHYRLVKSSPGQGAGPDGKDLGAEVDLVGPGEAYEKWKKSPEYPERLKRTSHR